MLDDQRPVLARHGGRDGADGGTTNWPRPHGALNHHRTGQRAPSACRAGELAHIIAGGGAEILSVRVVSVEPRDEAMVLVLETSGATGLQFVGEAMRPERGLSDSVDHIGEVPVWEKSARRRRPTRPA
jgi:hypothetical protein